MAFTIRDLLPRIRSMRPDLDAGTVERLTQEAAKRMMRECFLGQVIQTVFPLYGNTNTLMLTGALPYWDTTNQIPNCVSFSNSNVEPNLMILPANWTGTTPDVLTGIDPNNQQKTSCEVLRVIQVRTIKLPINASALFGGWLVQPYVSLPSPTSLPAGYFYINYGAGFVTVNGESYALKTGDIWQTDGSNWNYVALETYDTLKQVNGPTTNLYTNRPKSTVTSNTMSVQWSQRSGQSVIPNPVAPLPNFSIAVTPSSSFVQFDINGNQTSAITLQVTITRNNGYANPITVTFPGTNAFSATGFSATMDGFNNQTLASAPDSFTIVPSGTLTGWTTVEALWANVQLTGVGSDASTYKSNIFTVNPNSTSGTLSVSVSPSSNTSWPPAIFSVTITRLNSYSGTVRATLPIALSVGATSITLDQTTINNPTSGDILIESNVPNTFNIVVQCPANASDPLDTTSLQIEDNSGNVYFSNNFRIVPPL